jgi:hypothetical protein
MAEITSVVQRPYWRFFAKVPRAYCLTCLSRFFEEPPETIREFLDRVAGAPTYCHGCRRHPVETFRPRTFS